MSMIDATPLAAKLAEIRAAEAQWDALLAEGRDRHQTDSDDEHLARMARIDAAEATYRDQLVRLAALVQVSIERAERA